MVEKEIKIKRDVGLHARPAANFVKTAEKFKSKVWLTKNGIRVNGKSILSILSLAVEKGSKVILSVEGVDEEEAFKALKEILEKEE